MILTELGGLLSIGDPAKRFDGATAAFWVYLFEKDGKNKVMQALEQRMADDFAKWNTEMVHDAPIGLPEYEEA